jgi:lathosterol oxidase
MSAATTPALLDLLRIEEPIMALRYVAGSLVSGLGIYVLLGGFIYHRYYRMRKEEAAQWKCQPQRFPSERMRRYDLRLGIFNLSIGSALSGMVAYLAVRGHTALYFNFDRYGIALSILLALGYVLLTDLGLYAAHRLYHRPALFRAIHRFHHKNTTPTPFTAYAMHPVEFLTYESIAILPVFFYPVHAAVVIATLLYSNYVALLQHSGVRMSSILPWQPATRFHDDHHLCFHVNYGQNLMLWDRLFGTLRRHGRRYGAEVFGGRGASLVPGSAQRDDEVPRYIDYSRDPGPSSEPAPSPLRAQSRSA